MAEKLEKQLHVLQTMFEDKAAQFQSIHESNQKVAAFTQGLDEKVTSKSCFSGNFFSDLLVSACRCLAAKYLARIKARYYLRDGK